MISLSNQLVLMGKSAILLGATGLTGSILLNSLLNDKRYESVLVFGRNPTGVTHSKLREVIIDLFELENHKQEFVTDTVFCCIGTTKAKTPNKKKYREIDKGIPVTAARLSKENEINTFMVISSLGANDKSRIFYNRVKGEMEKEVLKLNIPETYILQPSLIRGDRGEKRFGEKIAGTLMSLLEPLMLGDLNKYKPISPLQISKGMVWLDNNTYKSGRIISDLIIEFSHS